MTRFASTLNKFLVRTWIWDLGCKKIAQELQKGKEQLWNDVIN